MDVPVHAQQGPWAWNSSLRVNFPSHLELLLQGVAPVCIDKNSAADLSCPCGGWNTFSLMFPLICVCLGCFPKARFFSSLCELLQLGDSLFLQLWRILCCHLLPCSPRKFLLWELLVDVSWIPFASMSLNLLLISLCYILSNILALCFNSLVVSSVISSIQSKPSFDFSFISMTVCVSFPISKWILLKLEMSILTSRLLFLLSPWSLSVWCQSPLQIALFSLHFIRYEFSHDFVLLIASNGNRFCQVFYTFYL